MADAFSVEGIGDYGQYQMWHNFVTDQGLVTVPIASDTPAHVTIRIHGGFGTRNVKWVAARSGKPPVIPAVNGASLIDGSDSLRNYNVEFTQQPNDALNGYNWTAKGSYQYIQETIRVPGAAVFPTNAYPYATEPMLSQSVALLSTAAQGGGSIVSVINAQDDNLDFTFNDFLWPHTFFPATATNSNLITTIPSV